jgi:hypothetical protein
MKRSGHLHASHPHPRRAAQAAPPAAPPGRCRPSAWRPKSLDTLDPTCKGHEPGVAAAAAAQRGTVRMAARLACPSPSTTDTAGRAVPLVPWGTDICDSPSDYQQPSGYLRTVQFLPPWKQVIRKMIAASTMTASMATGILQRCQQVLVLAGCPCQQERKARLVMLFQP